MTRQEARLWVALRRLRAGGFHFRRQVTIGRFIVDFACLQHRLIVEVDGSQHNTEFGVSRDMQRDAVLGSLGFRVARFWNAEIDTNLSGVVETVLALLKPADPAPVLRSAPARPSPPGRESAGSTLEP